MEQRVIKPLDGHPHQKYFVGELEVPGGSTVAKIGGEASGMIHRAWQLGMANRDYRQEWDESSMIGDITHAFIEENLIGSRVDLVHCQDYPMLVATARDCASKALWFVQENDFDILAVERQLARPIKLPDGIPYGYGGTIDLVVRANKDAKHYSSGDIILVDWKTSKGLYPVPNYCQIIGYEHLWNYRNLELQSKGRVIVRIGKGDGDDYQERWLKKPDQLERYWNLFQHQLGAWYWMKHMKYRKAK